MSPCVYRSPLHKILLQTLLLAPVVGLCFSISVSAQNELPLPAEDLAQTEATIRKTLDNYFPPSAGWLRVFAKDEKAARAGFIKLAEAVASDAAARQALQKIFPFFSGPQSCSDDRVLSLLIRLYLHELEKRVDSHGLRNLVFNATAKKLVADKRVHQDKKRSNRGHVIITQSADESRHIVVGWLNDWLTAIHRRLENQGIAPHPLTVGRPPDNGAVSGETIAAILTGQADELLQKLPPPEAAGVGNGSTDIDETFIDQLAKAAVLLADPQGGNKKRLKATTDFLLNLITDPAADPQLAAAVSTIHGRWVNLPPPAAAPERPPADTSPNRGGVLLKFFIPQTPPRSEIWVTEFEPLPDLIDPLIGRPAPLQKRPHPKRTGPGRPPSLTAEPEFAPEAADNIFGGDWLNGYAPAVTPDTRQSPLTRPALEKVANQSSLAVPAEELREIAAADQELHDAKLREFNNALSRAEEVLKKHPDPPSLALASSYLAIAYEAARWLPETYLAQVNRLDQTRQQKARKFLENERQREQERQENSAQLLNELIRIRSRLLGHAAPAAEEAPGIALRLDILADKLFEKGLRQPASQAAAWRDQLRSQPGINALINAFNSLKNTCLESALSTFLDPAKADRLRKLIDLLAKSLQDTAPPRTDPLAPAYKWIFDIDDLLEGLGSIQTALPSIPGPTAALAGGDSSTAAANQLLQQEVLASLNPRQRMALLTAILRAGNNPGNQSGAATDTLPNILPEQLRALAVDPLTASAKQRLPRGAKNSDIIAALLSQVTARLAPARLPGK